jgi:hypothetical protein
MHKSLLVAAVAAAFAASPALAQQKSLKIGFITTLSGPAGIIGKHMKDSVEMALEHLGRKVGGLPTEVIYGDDQFKPDVGLQVAEEMMKKNGVDIMSGIIWSNVMLAVQPAVNKAGMIMVGTNAGASPLAGKGCNELYFSTSWNNDQTPEAMGKFMQEQGINDVYVMAPNYQAGKDMVAGFKRYFKGRIVDEVFTQARGARPVRDQVLEPRPEGAGEPEVRGGLPEEVRLHARLLRRAELRRHHADRLGGPGGQGQRQGHQGHGDGHAQGELQLDPRQVHLQRQPPSDPGFLPAQGGGRPGRQGSGHADPEEGVRRSQGLVLQGLQDEVVALAGGSAQ